MLSTLRIRNLALVEELTLEFGEGFSALTGETGAGKSIVLGAIGLVVGDRADRTLVRTGADQCVVEAVFELGALEEGIGPMLEQAGVEPCEGGQLLIKRVVTAAGANKQFVNGTPTTLTLLGSLGEILVDIHGPHDHQSLLRPSKHLSLLDTFARLEADRDVYSTQVRERARLEEEFQACCVSDAEAERQLDLLRHQVGEIQAARLKPGEEDDLIPRFERATNAARLVELSNQALSLLSEGDGSLLDASGALGRTLQELKKVDSEAVCLLSLHEQALSFWNDLRADLSHYADSVELDPGQLQEMEERLDLIQQLKRKYGGSLDAVIEFGTDAARRLETLEDRATRKESLEGDIRRVDERLKKAAKELTAKRVAAAPGLAAAVAAELRELGFLQSRFELSVTEAWVSGEGKRVPPATGVDAVEFLFSPNPGEPLKPLKSVASSGELARVMLALRVVLASADNVPVLIFDEVDANVGGETAMKVGRKMRAIGARRQVLCVTHLAPVAAASRQHWRVEKAARGGRTVTEVRRLTDAESLAELARMLGGPTDSARRHAETLRVEAGRR